MSNQPTIFLDRDGVLIHDVHYLSNLNDIKLYEDVPSGLRQLQEAGFKLIMITNQSGVARGYFLESFVHQSYETINSTLSQSAVQLDHMYYCPHHPNGNEPYNFHCDCRKPEPGMIRKACEDYNIDLTRSFMLGDKICDIELALKAQVTGILLKTGYGESESVKISAKYPETLIFQTFTHAVNFILQKNNQAI